MGNIIIQRCYILTVLLLLYITGIRSDCSSANVNDVTNYVYIEEENYDRNYSSYDKNRRPLGYDKATVYFNVDIPNPCIKVTQASGRMFEVMIETTPSSSICIKITKNSEKLCGYNRLRSCDTAPGDAVYIEILCPDCQEADVNMWYRIRMSKKNDPDIENWCSYGTQNYPQDLYTAVLPPGFTFPPNDKGTNGTKRFTYSIIVVFVVLTFNFMI